MECITSTSFSVLINGSTHGYFYPKKGIRQKDPSSPYNFILCMEQLIKHFNEMATTPKSHVGIMSSLGGFKISNLVFADNCLLFARATTKGARNVLHVLNMFAKTSGQKVNFHKSSLYFSENTNAQTRNAIVNVLHIQHKNTIGKYLGIYNIVFWKDPVNECELIKRIKQKLAGWKTNTLSKAGRLTLIKSNLFGMPNHIMSCFKCPTRVTKNLNECRDFFWGRDRKLKPMAWKKVCTSKDHGGLGVRGVGHFNNACLATLVWKVLKDENNWWVQIVKRKHLKKDDFFSCKVKQNHSLAWKRILNSRH